MSPYTQSFFQENSHSNLFPKKILNIKIISLIFVFIIFGSIYILLFNYNIALSYKIEKLNFELKQLKDENQFLTLKFSQAANLNNLKIIAEELNLEEIKSVNFLNIEGNPLVKK